MALSVVCASEADVIGRWRASVDAYDCALCFRLQNRGAREGGAGPPQRPAVLGQGGEHEGPVVHAVGAGERRLET